MHSYPRYQAINALAVHWKTLAIIVDPWRSNLEPFHNLAICNGVSNRESQAHTHNVPRPTSGCSGSKGAEGIFRLSERGRGLDIDIRYVVGGSHAALGSEWNRSNTSQLFW